jgi:hypothetical protein
MKKIILVLILTSLTFVGAQESKKKKSVPAKKTVTEANKPSKNAKDSSAKETSSSDSKKSEEEGKDALPADAKTPDGAKDALPVDSKTTEETSKTPENTAKDTKTAEEPTKNTVPAEVSTPAEPPPEEKAKVAPPAFKGPNLIHMPTAQPLQKDILNFIFNHRFGDAKSTGYDFFGLDKGANTQLSLDYGLTDKLSLGFSRVTAFKTYEARSKYFIMPQTNSFPVSIAIFGSIGLETEKQTANMGPYILPPSSGYPVLDEAIKKKLNSYELTYSDRTSYLGSVLISRRFGERFSLQASPMFSHRNFVKPGLSNNRYGLDIGGKIQLNKSISFLFETILSNKRDYIGENYATVDLAGYGSSTNLTATQINSSYYKSSDLAYVYLRNVYFDKPVKYYSIPLSFGLSYESGGHIYNVFVTNSSALAHTQLLRGAEYDYKNREWTVGFNINRFFSFAKEVSEDNF